MTYVALCFAKFSFCFWLFFFKPFFFLVFQVGSSGSWGRKWARYPQTILLYPPYPLRPYRALPHPPHRNISLHRALMTQRLFIPLPFQHSPHPLYFRHGATLPTKNVNFWARTNTNLLNGATNKFPRCVCVCDAG